MKTFPSNKWLTRFDFGSYPENNGVYVIYALDTVEKTKKLIYVGKSANISRRILTHKIFYRQEFSEPLAFIRPFIKFKITDNASELEKKLIKKLSPPLNKIKYLG